MKNSIALLAIALFVGLRPSKAATLGEFRTTVGTIQFELYDEDKPITVSNFVKYVTSGEYTNQFIQRWDPGFVIQAGGFRITNTVNGPRITQPVPAFGTIKNEYKVGRTFSNTYGTLAMARVGGMVDSASSQWFLNLSDNNTFLDNVDEGFTVFGHVTGGTNVVNLFVPEPPTNNLYILNLQPPSLTEIPVRTNSIGTLDELFASLIYFDIRLYRDMNLTIKPLAHGQRSVTWNTVAGVTNVLEYATNETFSNWTTSTNVVGSGSLQSIIDNSADPRRIYRVKLFY